MTTNVFKYSLFLLWFISSASWANNHQTLSPLPEEVTDKWNNISLLGQTRLSHFGFNVYDASFWVIGEKLDSTNTSDFLESNSFALSITYARNLSKQQLLSSTEKEWQKLGFTDRYPLDLWLSMLQNIWPSVEKGDQLIVVVTKDGKTSFFNKNKILGTIDDKYFGPALLSIWLDENSRFKKNRKELLGEQKTFN